MKYIEKFSILFFYMERMVYVYWVHLPLGNLEELTSKAGLTKRKVKVPSVCDLAGHRKHPCGVQ